MPFPSLADAIVAVVNVLAGEPITITSNPGRDRLTPVSGDISGDAARAGAHPRARVAQLASVARSAQHAEQSACRSGVMGCVDAMEASCHWTAETRRS